MRFDELFEMRKLTGIKLKNYISGNGFSKVSFCKKTEFSTKTQSVDAMYSQKALINYQMNDKAKMEYDLLQDILNLCSVYY